MSLMINLPTYTMKGPKIKLSPEYKKRFRNSLFCNSMKDSLENVEKVVNPPHSPTVRNKRHSGDMKLLLSEIPKKTPMRRLPSIFTKKVPQGNTEA